MNLSEGLVSAFGMDASFRFSRLPPARSPSTAVVAPKVKARLELSRAKHRSLTGHSKMSRRVARLIPFYEFDINEFFRSDGAPPEVAARRQDGFFRLAALYKERFAKGRQMTSEAAGQISDLQFTQAYRVPFQYSRLVRENLGAGTLHAVVGGRHADRSRRQSCSTTSPAPTASTSSATTSTRNASRSPRSARMRSARCSASIIPSSPTTSAGSARFPGSTRSRSTCRAPKR